MFDSRDYEFADLELNLAGKDVVDIKALKWRSKIDREPKHAKGREPHSIQSGKKTYEGEVTVTLAGYYKILNAAPKRDILELRGTTATATFGNPSEGVAPNLNTITGIYFTEHGPETKQGDKVMDVTLPFIALKVV